MSSPKLRLSPEQDGYLLDGVHHVGFADREDLEEPPRDKLARWAVQLRPDEASDAQRARVESQTSRLPGPRREAAIRRAELLASPVIRSLWTTLSDEEQTLVLNPEDRLGAKARYPLTAGALAKLVAIDTQQVRRWGDAHLVPSTRDHNGHRQFGAAAAIIAFSLRDSKQNDREYYRDIARSPAPLSAMRRAISLITYSAFAGEATAQTSRVAGELDALSKTMHELAAALSRAARAVEDAPVGSYPPGGSVELDLHRLGALVRLAEPVADDAVAATQPVE